MASASRKGFVPGLAARPQEQDQELDDKCP